MKVLIRSALLAVMVALLCSTMGAAPAAAAGKGVVNINTANTQQLQLLDGVGESKARAIIDFRRSKRFSSPEDLMKVKGIGKGLYTKIRKQVVIKGETTAQPAKKKKSKRRK